MIWYTIFTYNFETLAEKVAFWWIIRLRHSRMTKYQQRWCMSLRLVRVRDSCTTTLSPYSYRGAYLWDHKAALNQNLPALFHPSNRLCLSTFFYRFSLKEFARKLTVLPSWEQYSLVGKRIPELEQYSKVENSTPKIKFPLERNC